MIHEAGDLKFLISPNLLLAGFATFLSTWLETDVPLSVP